MPEISYICPFYILWQSAPFCSEPGAFAWLSKLLSMSRMAETTVQGIALSYLEKRYRRRARRGRIFAEPEVRTKKEHGSKRADGLLAFKHWLWGVYVVSLEAKSYKTLPAINPKLDRQLFAFNVIRAGLIISILSGAFFFLYKWNDGFWQFIIPGGVFLLSGGAYAWLTRNHFGHRTLRVVEQIQQYPADERWLAFSKDAYHSLEIEKQRQLEHICRYHGIGLLVVSANGKADVLAKSRFNWDWWHDYLRFYSREQDIRSAI